MGGTGAVLRPVGPRPGWVYWLRRAGLIIVVAALVAGLAHACGGSSKPAAAPTPSRTTSPTPTPQPSTRPGVCRKHDLSVTSSTDALTYPAGVLPHLTAVVHNVSGQPCRLTTAPGLRSWVISSGT